MKLKFFELRDKATFIPVFAFSTRSFGNELGCDPSDQERWLLRRSGFSPDSKIIILGRLECSGCDRNCSYDPYAWGGRTYPVAHKYIEEHWFELQSGSVIDVEFILNERETPKLSEAVDPFDEISRRNAEAVTPAPSTQVEALSSGETTDQNVNTL